MADVKNSSTALVALAWIVVGVPLCWGVYKSGVNAVKLFKPQPVATAPVTTAPVPPK